MTTATGFVVDTSQTAGFLGRLWGGEAPLSRLYWRDMLIVGSFINVFLVLALWRTPGRSTVMTWTSLLWLSAVTLL